MNKEIEFILLQLKTQYNIQKEIIEYIQRIPSDNNVAHITGCQRTLNTINEQIKNIETLV